MKLFGKLKKVLTSENGLANNEDACDLSDHVIKNEASGYGKQIDITDEDKQKLVASLTLREHDLYLLLLEGFTLKESAKQLSVKYSTVNTHMTGIYKKLGVNSRAELIINYRYIKDRINSP